jgi:hypothetical protein
MQPHILETKVPAKNQPAVLNPFDLNNLNLNWTLTHIHAALE